MVHITKVLTMSIKIGILTASDRASKGEYEDISGPSIIDLLSMYLKSDWEPVYELVPDDRKAIERAFINLVDKKNCCLVVSTGGTGPALRDVTPEATEAVCDKMIPGFGEQMREASFRHVPTAILSRQTAGIRKKTLIINLPGKPKAIKECLEAVFPAVPYCIDLLEGPFIEVNTDVIDVFRPKNQPS